MAFRNGFLTGFTDRTPAYSVSNAQGSDLDSDYQEGDSP